MRQSRGSPGGQRDPPPCLQASPPGTHPCREAVSLPVSQRWKGLGLCVWRAGCPGMCGWNPNPGGRALSGRERARTADVYVRMFGRNS